LLTQNHEEQTTADTICLGDADWPFSDPASRDFVPRSPCVDCRHIPFSLPPTARRNLAGTINFFPPGPTCLLLCETLLPPLFLVFLGSIRIRHETAQSMIGCLTVVDNFRLSTWHL